MRTLPLAGRVMAARPPSGWSWPGRWRALTVSLLGAFMTLLDTSIVNVALPSIERDLGESGPLRPGGRIWTG
jgi:hypothetical protein